VEAERLDLVYRVLDLQLVDVDGRRCGKVDDVELSGEPLRATALLSGTGTFPDRLPRRLLPRLARRLVGRFVLGGNVVRIPWEEVDEIGPPCGCGARRSTSGSVRATTSSRR
jgi:sporulation protein YlmC with PRC-barrel domain